ncbi:MAG: hypothetical protein U9O87_04705 [Verrucomicrobiota bacterium]|nr:hypothetical protein [Verrucomicrobiota bacterium]
MIKTISRLRFEYENLNTLTYDIIAECEFSKGEIYDFHIPVKKEEDLVLRQKYLLARLHNILTVSSPKCVTLYVPEEIIDEILSYRQILLNTSKSYSIIPEIIERMYQTRLKIDVFTHQDIKKRRTLVKVTNNKHKIFNSVKEKANGIIMGVDFGGTDLKIVILQNSEIIFSIEHVWNPPPKQYDNPKSYQENILQLIYFSLAVVSLKQEDGLYEMKEAARMLVEDENSSLAEKDKFTYRVKNAEIIFKKPLYVGLSFPDIILNNMIVGGMTSKYTALREKFTSENGVLKEDYWEQFNKFIRPMPLNIAKSLKKRFSEKIPVHIINDGNAGALWGFSESNSHGILAFSLGTSLAGGGGIKRKPLEGIFEIGNMIILPEANEKQDRIHRNLDLYGTAQQLLSQDTVFHLAEKKGLINEFPQIDEANVLKQIQKMVEKNNYDAIDIFQKMGENLVFVLDSLLLAIPDTEFDQLILFGRVVRGKSGDILMKKARDILQKDPLFKRISKIKICRASELHDDKNRKNNSFKYNVFAQALGAIVNI